MSERAAICSPSFEGSAARSASGSAQRPRPHPRPGEEPGGGREKVLDGEGSFGYNARTEVYEDLIKAGVIDPTKVTRTALQNAASVAGLLLTTEAVISEKPEEDKGGAPAMPDMGGMGGMGGMM